MILNFMFIYGLFAYKFLMIFLYSNINDYFINFIVGIFFFLLIILVIDKFIFAEDKLVKLQKVMKKRISSKLQNLLNYRIYIKDLTDTEIAEYQYYRSLLDNLDKFDSNSIINLKNAKSIILIIIPSFLLQIMFLFI